VQICCETFPRHGETISAIFVTFCGGGLYSGKNLAFVQLPASCNLQSGLIGFRLSVLACLWIGGASRDLHSKFVIQQSDWLQRGRHVLFSTHFQGSEDFSCSRFDERAWLRSSGTVAGRVHPSPRTYFSQIYECVLLAKFCIFGGIWSQKSVSFFLNGANCRIDFGPCSYPHRVRRFSF
jgi:hypothetical protein